MWSKAISPFSSKVSPSRSETGEAFYLRPNVVHRGMNKTDKPVKLFVVRIKPKDAPLVVDVPAPPQQ